ncbi:hypothetical protein XELAEV_18004041mg [Xenopus laevis]|uniref:Uncharacterized protein n=1 Tax=Xenopus laevis TaxID=8355 RepID=A0A974BMV7_XENLA|nr:hypothetical protein XELAEV_18004041mg [Xenopus laevis]
MFLWENKSRKVSSSSFLASPPFFSLSISVELKKIIKLVKYLKLNRAEYANLQLGVSSIKIQKLGQPCLFSLWTITKSIEKQNKQYQSS